MSVVEVQVSTAAILKEVLTRAGYLGPIHRMADSGFICNVCLEYYAKKGSGAPDLVQPSLS